MVQWFGLTVSALLSGRPQAGNFNSAIQMLHFRIKDS